jgi:hypothetical protein
MTLPSNTGGGSCDRFREPSPFAADRGEKIGKDPRKIPVSDLRDLGHPESYPAIIRAICLDCVYQPSEVRKCVRFNCPAWPVRMGVNVFHKGRVPDRRPAKEDNPEGDPSGGNTGGTGND